MPSSATNAPSTTAEVSLVHLKSCLVNLPPSLVSLLDTVSTPAQNVIVELSYQFTTDHTPSQNATHANSQGSVYLGWTGMSSKRRAAPIVGRSASHGLRSTSSRDQDVPLVELDATLAATLGLQDSQRVLTLIHVNAVEAHTISVEPLTPEDWEIIELHATFLELNMLSQIRALPNPSFTSANGIRSAVHPITLHLTPTVTANIKVNSLEPPIPSHIPFAKIARDAEVIVAPKTRSKPLRTAKSGRSVTSASRKSGRSSASTVRRKSMREGRRPACLLLRGMDRRLCADWFDDAPVPHDLSVWIDWDLVLSKAFAGVKWVSVSIVRPAGLEPPLDPQKPLEVNETTATAATRIIAQLRPWPDPPNGQAAAMSAPLCATLGCESVIGAVIKLEQAPAQLPRFSSTGLPGASQSSVQRLKIYPFGDGTTPSSGGALSFGGETMAAREEAAKAIKHMYSAHSRGLLLGPLTDGQVLGCYEGLECPSGWQGGLAKFDPPPTAMSSPTHGPSKETVRWIHGSEWHLPIEVLAPVPRPAWLPPPIVDEQQGTELADNDDDGLTVVGIDSLLRELQGHLSHMSSVLLTGGHGSGKTCVARRAARQVRREHLYHTTYFTCTKLVNDETRIASIKETLTRVFMAASWGARLGGKAVVILDDLDRLCPAETELQVSNDNGRSRQISEAVCSIVRQHCSPETGVVLVATCETKDSLHKVVANGHLFRSTVELKAPNREARRLILESIVREQQAAAEQARLPSLATRLEHYAQQANGSRPLSADGQGRVTGKESSEWMDVAVAWSSNAHDMPLPRVDGPLAESGLDFVEVAGQTDGYMPADLLLLVVRARNEALIRSAAAADKMSKDDVMTAIELDRADFESALKGFRPASLRNVTLQSSTTKFDAIGGLEESRRVLLETFEYPTKYAPIFAHCPLRLRSGILLYGYPGCGKTLLASAVAGECGLNFISVKGPEILNKYIGASEKSVRDLFERAQAAKPCVLFFDEFDSIAPKRGHDSTGVTDRVVNQLLTQMDGAEGLSGVYVLAATSRPDLIDPALLRPGRLDKSILCDFPHIGDRIDIIQALSKKVKISDEVLSSESRLRELGRLTDGFTGADLQALVSNAQLEVIHDVLDDRGPGHATVGTSTSSHRRSGPRHLKDSTSPSTRHNFIQFRYGDDDSTISPNGAPPSRSTQLADQAAITAKLESIRLARKRAKRVTPPSPGRSSESAGVSKVNNSQIISPEGDKTRSDRNNVVIGWEHLLRALDGTRASISVQERTRLQRIYREFVMGRSGEMRDGQGSMEIGGRSSLM